MAGHIRMRVAAKDFDLPVGHLLAFDYEVRHEVETLEDSAFLLTISRPIASGTKEA